MSNEPKNNEKSRFESFLNSKISTYWAFALAIVMMVTSVGIPFYQLKTTVKILEQRVEHNNTLVSNHISTINKNIIEIKEENEKNRERWEEVSQELAAIKSLIQSTH